MDLLLMACPATPNYDKRSQPYARSEEWREKKGKPLTHGPQFRLSQKLQRAVRHDQHKAHPPAMPGKKRTTNQKTSATSKRHKSSGQSSSKPSKPKSGGAPRDGGDDAPAPAAHTGSFPADKPKMQSAKKDRKGKGPAFIPAVERDLSDSDSEGAMDVDEDLEDLDDQADFLTSLDMKGMAQCVLSC